MQITYQVGSLVGLAAGGDEPEKVTPAIQVRDYREVFNPREKGQPVDRNLHSEPSQRMTNYIEIARLVRSKKAVAT